MVNTKFRRIAAVFAVMLAFTFTLLLGGFTQAKAAETTDVTSKDVGTYYSEYRNAVKSTLDEDDGGEPKYFKLLKNELEPAAAMQTMTRVVAAAQGYTEIANVKKAIGKAGRYLTDDYDGGLKGEFDALNLSLDTLLQNELKLTEANYKTYDSENTFTAKIDALKKSYKVFLEKVELENVFYDLFAVNNSVGAGQGNEKLYAGFYDMSASVKEGYGGFYLAELYEDGKVAIETAENPSETRKQYADKLKAVPKNIFEKIYNYYLEATADERGGEVAREDLLKNPIYDDLQNDSYNLSKCKDQVNTFYRGASAEVVAKYATQYKNLENYFNNHQGYVAWESNLDTLIYAVNYNTVMTVKAYFTSTDEPAKVFDQNASIKLYSGTLSGEKTAVAAKLREKNGKLGAGYLVRFNVYGGAAQSKVFDTETVDWKNGGIYYTIELNLDNFYKEIVSKDTGIVGDLLSNASMDGVWGSKDNNSKIKDAYELINGTDVDLCYFYKDGDLEEFDEINYNPEGGILMLKTTQFGNFAIAAKDSGGFTPLMMVILIAAILVAVIALIIILSVWKYSVKFYSNGGSAVKKVKARKGEYFVMPENPVRPGYVFAGWFEDRTLLKRFLATRIVERKNLKAYAKWLLELTPERVDAYYTTLRDALASHAAVNEQCEFKPDEVKTFAVIEKGEKTITLSLALDVDTLKANGYTVETTESEETPARFVIATREDFVVAQKLVVKLFETHDLQTCAYQPATDGETSYTLAVSAPVEEPAAEEVVEEVVEEPVEEPVEEATPFEEPAEETVEEVTEEVVEETVEETVEEPVEETVEEELTEEPVEEPAEETVEEEPATEEQLIEYFTTVRNAVCGYALYEKNDNAENGKMLIKLYKKDEAVYCYMALDAASYGLETVGLGFSDTPALLKVANDEDLQKALELVEILMLEHGFEKSDEPVEEKPYEGKGFGYRIHYVEE